MEDVWLVAASHKDYALLITPLISLNFSLRMKQRISKFLLSKISFLE
jgi:hypothetical protein